MKETALSIDSSDVRFHEPIPVKAETMLQNYTRTVYVEWQGQGSETSNAWPSEGGAVSIGDFAVASDQIVSLPDGLQVEKTIPVTFEKYADGWIAWFKEAEIGMSGDTKEEARELLAEDIAHAYVTFSEKRATLGRGPALQLDILRRYISRR